MPKIVKEALKGMFFGAFNSGVFIMSAFLVFHCQLGPTSSKFLYFGIFILPLLIALYYTLKIMKNLEEKNTANLIMCLVFGPNLMIVPSVALWMVYAKSVSECLALG